MNSLKIGPFTFVVAPTSELRGDDKNYDGQLKHGTSSILLSHDMDRQATLQTRMHEVIHEIAIQAGQEMTEGLIDAIAYGWIQTMRDNPELVKMIRHK